MKREKKNNTMRNKKLEKVELVKMQINKSKILLTYFFLELKSQQSKTMKWKQRTNA